jgi:hypothetical protein
LGSYDTIGNDLGFSDDKIKTLKKEIANSLFQNVSNVENGMEPKKEDEPFIQKDNVDISGEDVTDFDTIYEFLERFDGRIYSIDDEDKYLCDLEESDFIEFLYKHKIYGEDTIGWFLKSDDFKQEILQEAIYINIRDEKRRFN